MAFAPAVYPVPNRFINVAKEPTPGSIVAATYTFPLTSFKPVDKYTRLEDNAWRNAMGDLYNLIGGVRISDVSLGGPIFADGLGYILLNALGDYYQAVSGGVIGTSSSLSGSVAIGATTVVVSSGTGMSVGNIVSIGAVGSTAEEVRKITAISAGLAPGTLTLNAALYQGHASAGTVITYSSQNGITHNFALLNGALTGYNGAGGFTASQPATYTFTDYTGLPASTGARTYSYACVSEVSITGAAEGLVEFDAKITALASQIAASQPTVNLTSVQPQPSWVSTVQLAGSGTNNVSSWKLTLSRKLTPKYTNQGTQDPFSIPRGALGAMLALDFDPASDEAEFIDYLNNTQPTCVITANNGLSGTNAASLVITANQLGFTDGALEDTKEVFGFTDTAKLIDNTTNVGPSQGFGPCVISLTNGQINY